MPLNCVDEHDNGQTFFQIHAVMLDTQKVHACKENFRLVFIKKKWHRALNVRDINMFHQFDEDDNDITMTLQSIFYILNQDVDEVVEFQIFDLAHCIRLE